MLIRANQGVKSRKDYKKPINLLQERPARQKYQSLRINRLPEQKRISTKPYGVMDFSKLDVFESEGSEDWFPGMLGVIFFSERSFGS